MCVVFGQQIRNVSQGLYPDGNTNTYYFMTNWTPRAANTLAGPLRLTGLTFNGGAVALTWSAISNRLYRVQFKDNLDSSSWLPLGNDVLAADSTASATDSLPPNSRRFYRVVRLE